MSIVLEVQGMSCQHCVGTITSAVSALPGVTSVDVDLDGGSVRVSGTAEDAAVVAAITDAGYGVGSNGTASDGAGSDGAPTP